MTTRRERKNALARDLRTARKAKAQTQEQAAREIGVAHNSFTRWEQAQNLPQGLYARAVQWYLDSAQIAVEADRPYWQIMRELPNGQTVAASYTRFPSRPLALEEVNRNRETYGPTAFVPADPKCPSLGG